ncbi:MAG: DUF4190 domain-containing protein [Phycisphaeraceae bacterium]|nr:DUF4190 domain-containing protein [Phycisphaeraceae bacterium]
MTPDSGTYTLKRGNDSFGPYTASEVAAYLSSGNIVAADTLFDHETQAWITAGALVARFKGNTIPHEGASPGSGGGASSASDAAWSPPAVTIAAQGAPSSGAPPLHRGPPSALGAPDRSGQAIAAFVLGILSVTGCGLVTGVIAIILGYGARDDVKQGTLAKVGMVLGIAGTALSVLGGACFFLGAIL